MKPDHSTVLRVTTAITGQALRSVGLLSLVCVRENVLYGLHVGREADRTKSRRTAKRTWPVPLKTGNQTYRDDVPSYREALCFGRSQVKLPGHAGPRAPTRTSRK